MTAGAPATPAPAITSFDEDHAFLSNFYPSPVEWEGALYPTVENAFQAAKSLDPAARLPFRDCGPDEAKGLGGRLALRPGWDGMRVPLMAALLRAKFEIPALRRRLLATGTADLVNRNLYGDDFWGLCRGRGRNELGRLLMAVRAELATGRPLTP